MIAVCVSMEKTRKKTIEDYFEIEDAQLEATLERFLADEKQKPKTSKINIASISGFLILMVSTIYLFGTYIFPGLPDTSGLLQTITVIGGILVLFTGLGAFSRTKRKKRRSSKRRNWNDVNDQPMDTYGLRQRKRLTRSKKERKLFGVCGGIANYFNIDPTVVRILFVILALSYGTSILIYIILAVALPEESLIDEL